MDLAGIVWKTTDAGRSWISRAVCGEPIHAIHYFDSANIVCVGGDFDFGAGAIFTTDAGEHWSYKYLAIWGEAKSLSFRTENEGWATLGFSGTIMYTRDKGRNWTDIYSPDTTSMFDVQFTDVRNGFMVGGEGTILKFNKDLLGVEENKIGRASCRERVYVLV